MAITVVNEEDTVYNTTTTPKTTGSFSVEVDDLIVITAHMGEADIALGTPTNTGTALTWTLHQFAYTSGSGSYMWTARATVSESITVSVTQASATRNWGFNRTTLRGTGGAGASVKTSAQGSGIPSISLTTVRPGSAIFWCINDDASVDASASKVYLTDAGSHTEITYSRQGTAYAVYTSVNIATTTPGAYTVGLSAPIGQTYHMIALEILLPHTKRPGFGAYLSGGLAT